MTEAEKAYAAGFWDGEGCICVTKRVRGNGRPNYAVILVLANANEEVIDWLQARWGGKVNRQIWPAGKPWKPQNRWRLRGVEAKKFLADVRPYLVVKAAAADNAVLLWAMHDAKPNPRTRLSEDAVDSQEKIYQSNRLLNYRGLVPA